MKTLLCCIPNPRDVTSYYRGLGAIGQVSRKDESDWNILVGQEVYDDICYLTRGAFLQRPFTDEHVKIAKMLKRNGINVWLDYDDDLFNLPTDNPAYDIYGDQKIRRNMAELIAMADIVSVTTDFLKEKLCVGPMKGKDVRVVPNAINFERHKQTPLKERNDFVVWRGSKTHQKDVVTVAKQIVEMYKASSKTVWEFLGDRQWMVTDAMIQHDPRRVIYHKGIDVIEYFQHLIDSAPKTFIAPLADHPFNKAKSNIAFLEAAFCGALCIAPKFDEWDVPGCITYDPKFPEDFADRFKAVMSGKLDSQAEIALAWVKEHRSLSKVNLIRKQIIKEIMG